MAIANCKRCGKIYNRVRRDICPQCIAEEDEAFHLVRTYLRENRDATIEDVVEETGVPMELIISMIQDGRLILRDNPNIFYACEHCGQPTQSGRFCAACSRELSTALQKAGEGLRQRMGGDKTSRGYFSRS
ncbi:hypothetical protein JI721_08430 [Alicyclobacillus cycloheptanicus]|uniref:Flagellar operon protein (TIGR03826 family) n=1 Tax=Alicyclobacillus cycloheptanicus TaxID=1457 RepID=A0ABT9XLB3_9BACL|nr:TIGR03826 family flagellar region protein [Alicyclobacillus cycloheptanicus]MDQ0191094.1 flagellar operon protein (TIGR03826 family) [Alicyclobacillus cycloheptanicus]WDL99826.1 hypothetical protein JI721_08430 [Alicyclobacillus cycloheptanicus]